MADRSDLERALDHLRTGDALVIWRLDRLGRSLRHLIDTVHRLNERQIGFCPLTESIDTDDAGGRLVFHVFAALAEFERELTREMYASRQHTVADIAAGIGVSCARVYRLSPERVLRPRGILAPRGSQYVAV